MLTSRFIFGLGSETVGYVIYALMAKWFNSK